MTTPLVSAPDYLGRLVAEYDAGTTGDSLVIRSEFDPEFLFEAEAGFERAFAELLELAAASVPAGCEVTIAAMRTTAAVARLGAGKVVLRWQVMGAPDEPVASNIVPIHSVEVDGPALVDSTRVHRLRGAFTEAGWRADFESLAEGREIWVQLTRG